MASALFLFWPAGQGDTRNGQPQLGRSDDIRRKRRDGFNQRPEEATKLALGRSDGVKCILALPGMHRMIQDTSFPGAAEATVSIIVSATG